MQILEQDEHQHLALKVTGCSAREVVKASAGYTMLLRSLEMHCLSCLSVLAWFHLNLPNILQSKEQKVARCSSSLLSNKTHQNYLRVSKEEFVSVKYLGSD